MPVACRGAQVAMCAGQAARRAAANNQNNGSMRKSVGGDQSMARRQPGKGAPKESPKKAEKEKPKTLPKRILMGVLDFLDQTWLQTLQYIVFLFAFQSLTATIRKSEEFYFDKYLTDTFINNPFDGDHNRLVDVRRISDIWEWKDRVLTPGLFSQAVEGEVWPDGDGASLLTGATPLSTADVVDTDNIVSITDGIIIKQVRCAHGHQPARRPLPTHTSTCTHMHALCAHIRRARIAGVTDARAAHRRCRLLRQPLVLR